MNLLITISIVLDFQELFLQNFQNEKVYQKNIFKNVYIFNSKKILLHYRFYLVILSFILIIDIKKKRKLKNEKKKYYHTLFF